MSQPGATAGTLATSAVGLGGPGIASGVALLSAQISGGVPGGALLAQAGPASGVVVPGAGAAVAGASPLDALISPAQRLLIAGLSALEARALVQAAQVQLHAQDSDIVVQYKLGLATWAAEAARPAEDFRALPAAVRTVAMGYLGVDTAWAEPLQNAFLASAFTLCQRAAWAADPALSHGGILFAGRLAFLNIMCSIGESAGVGASSRSTVRD